MIAEALSANARAQRPSPWPDVARALRTAWPFARAAPARPASHARPTRGHGVVFSLSAFFCTLLTGRPPAPGRDPSGPARMQLRKA